MACKEELILQFVEAELPKAEIAEVKKHLKTCTVCSAMVEELRPVIESLREMDAPLMRPYEVLSMRQRVLTGGPLALPAAVPPPRLARAGIVPPKKNLPPWLEAAAVILFGISIGLLAFSGGIAYTSKIKEASVAAVTSPTPATAKQAIASLSATPAAEASPALRVERSTLTPQHKKLVLNKTTEAGNRIIWNFEPLAQAPRK